MTPEDRFKQLGSAEGSSPSEAEWLDFRAAAHRSLTRRRIAATVGGLGLVVALVAGTVAVANLETGDKRGPGVAGTPTTAPTDDTDDPTPAPDETPESPKDEPKAKAQDVYVQQWYIETDGTLMVGHWPIQGHIQGDSELERASLDVLLSIMPGPLGETGVTSAIPEQTELTNLTIQDKTASVTLYGDRPEDGDQAALAEAQIVYTLTQFPTIEEVAISWESESRETRSPPATRKTYEDLLPPIVVESPRDGEEVGRTFTLSGIANVFEANVSWRIVGKAERYEKEGFITATCGSGCWGTFSDKITYDGAEESVTLQVFQASAEDGSPMNMVEIPLNIRN